MNFFKSVFSDDPDPPQRESEPDFSNNRKEEREDPDQDSSSQQSSPSEGGAWSFGGLIKTLATRSESVIQTYRRDLKEFGSGLKKEIEVAQGSLGTVGHAIDEFGNSVMQGTAQIIVQGKDAILAADHESDSSDNNSNKSFGGRESLSSKRYSRLDAQVRAVQGDVNTYCEEPEDLDDYNKWKLGFVLDQKGGEVEKLFEENAHMKAIYKRVVPNSVDDETFWFRYFYKLHKLKLAEDLRANIVKRAISQEDEEELSWDIDEEEEDGEKAVDASKEISKMKLKEKEELGSRDIEQKTKAEASNADLKTNKASSWKNEDLVNKDSEEIAKEENFVEDSKDGDKKNEKISDSDDKASKDNIIGSSGENMVLGKESSESNSNVNANSEFTADSEDSRKTIQGKPSVQEEEDLGWDDIEDLSSIDEKEVARSGGSPNRAEQRKRLSGAEEEEEDLSWDIEDDDEPVSKA